MSPTASVLTLINPTRHRCAAAASGVSLFNRQPEAVLASVPEFVRTMRLRRPWRRGFRREFDWGAPRRRPLPRPQLRRQRLSAKHPAPRALSSVVSTTPPSMLGRPAVPYCSAEFCRVVYQFVADLTRCSS